MCRRFKVSVPRSEVKCGHIETILGSEVGELSLLVSIWRHMVDVLSSSTSGSIAKAVPALPTSEIGYTLAIAFRPVSGEGRGVWNCVHILATRACCVGS